MKKQTILKRKQKRISTHLEQVNLYAAGIDIGSTSHYVAVPAELDDQPVREFPFFTGDLNRMADWLVKMGIQTVAVYSEVDRDALHVQLADEGVFIGSADPVDSYLNIEKIINLFL